MSRPKTTVSVLRIEPRDAGELVKAGDLIDLKGAAELTLADRRTFNILLRNAHGPELGEPGATFEIDLSELRDAHDSNDRIVRSITALMGVVVRIEGDSSWDEDGLGLTQLLGDTDISHPRRKRGRMRYTFPPKMAKLLANASVYARMQTDVMMAFRSKYSLVLYELVSKRAGLQMTREYFHLDKFRDVMGVPSDKLVDWSNLRKFCIEPAVAEVTQMAHFWCAVQPQKEGRQTVGVYLMWGPKDDSALMEAQRELMRHSAGRKARRTGRAETIS